jgi:hypothetical protein
MHMTSAARSVFVFGIYVAVIGVAFVLIPNVMLALVFLPATEEVWIRVIGMLLLILSFYYIQAARNDMTDFLRWTVYARSTVVLFLIAFVVLGFAGPGLLPFGIIDLAGAIWTGMALRSAQAA